MRALSSQSKHGGVRKGFKHSFYVLFLKHGISGHPSQLVWVAFEGISRCGHVVVCSIPIVNMCI
jgi:hypothetical protein